MTTAKYDPLFYRTNASTSAASAAVLLRALGEIYQAQTLLDVGCGIGTWGQAARDLGFSKYQGVDGDYVRRKQLLVAPTEFAAHDLRTPLDLRVSYDLAICMEVGEHLPAADAATLVKSLCAHAPVVMFSAAIPGQGGVDHINEQWQSYWAELFAREGYGVHDCIRPGIWDRDDVAEYYRQNVLVYVDGRNAGLASLFGENLQGRAALLDVVHPATYRIKSDPMRWQLSVVLKNLPAILLRVVKNRLLPS